MIPRYKSKYMRITNY